MAGWRIAAALALLVAGGSWAQTAAEVRALLDKGEAARAYELGRRAPQRLGEPEFDLAFGIAAIHAGRPSEGVLALERFLLLQPGHEAARVELARGYFLMGDDARAREELEAALARGPPAAVARVIREHLAALRERESRRRPTFAAYVEAGGGYDSNPRAGVDNALITLPVFGEVTVPDAGVRVGDRAWQLAGGLRATLPVVGRTVFFLNAHAERLRYAEQRDFDQDLFAGSSGFMSRWRDVTWRAGASRGYQRLGRVPYRHNHGGFADVSLALGARDAVSAGLQAGKLEYAGANAVRDSDFGAIALGWRHGFAHAWNPQMELAMNGGRERNVSAARQDLSRDMAGARVAFAVAPWADWLVAVGVTYQSSRYREPDAVLETTREDRYVAADLALSWAVTPGLALRLELTEAKNRSNLALYEHRRRTAMLRGRYEFR